MEHKNSGFAKTLLLPGDPNRAKFISENYLRNSTERVIENNLAVFTGEYMDCLVSIAGSGMGIPSVLMTANRLYKDYGVDNIIRIGTCGTAHKDVNIGDMLIASGCSTTSGFNRHSFYDRVFCPTADFKLLKTAVDIANSMNLKVKIGNLLSTDLFYDLTTIENANIWWDFGILGVEMEGSGLYTSAHYHNKRALTICTVSDTIIDRKGMSPEQRETSLHEMISLGLNTATSFNKH